MYNVLYFGAREHLVIYSLTIFYTSVKLCGCQSIWDLKFEEYWEECDQLSDTHVIVHNTLTHSLLEILPKNAF